MNALTVYQYAWKFSRRAEAAGRGTQYPSIRQAAKRFGVLQADVLEIVEDGWVDDAKALDLIVGYRINSGYGSFDLAGDYQIEAYER